MGKQHMLNINRQLAFLMNSEIIKWRDCQRKKYNVCAIVPPAGYVFANKLEQPEQFQYIKNKFKTLVVKESQLSKEDKLYLGNNCYVTDGTRVVICGTRGECWTVKPDKFMASYTNTDGSPITKVPTKWTEFSRAQESAPSAKGIQIPVKHLGVYQASWGRLTLNDPRSTGHYRGDILVVSMDWQSISPINNEVFAMTFNLNVGGWAQSGCITPVGKLRPFTIEDAKKHYKFGSEQKHTNKTDSTATKDSRAEKEKVIDLVYDNSNELKHIVKSCIDTAYTGSHRIVVAGKQRNGKYIVYEITHEDCKRSIKSVNELYNDRDGAINFDFRDCKGRRVLVLKQPKILTRELQVYYERNPFIIGGCSDV